MQQSSEDGSNQRLDHAGIVDFLTSTAAALAEAGLIGNKETDNLRFALSGIASARSGGGRSLLVELDVQHAEFLGLLTARFGTVGVCLNLLRHTLRGPLEESLRLLTAFGQELLKKSALMFNRPFFIYRGSHCQKQALFSRVIVDYAESLERGCESIEQALRDLALMNPNELAAATEADYGVDAKIAKALGFTGLVASALPVQSEAACKRQVTQALTLVAEAAIQLAEQLAANTDEALAHDVLAACESLKAECQRLQSLEFPRSESLLIWEVRRCHIIACIGALNAAIAAVATATLAAIGPDAGRRPQALPEAARRRLIHDLIVTGTTPAKATEAVVELLRYLDINRIKASAVLSAELTRIHPQLTAETLNTLKILHDDASLMTLASSEKTTTMARVVRLTESFQAAASRHGITLALLLSCCLAGCGLKTRPQSAVPELRPDLPFRIDAPSKPVDAAQPEKDTQGAQQLKPGGPPDDGTTQKQP